MDVVRQAGRVDVRRQDEGLGQVDEGEVVLQVLRAEAGMNGDVLGKAVLVRLRLDRLLRVPLAGPYLDVGCVQMTAKRKCQICLFANEDLNGLLFNQLRHPITLGSTSRRNNREK